MSTTEHPFWRHMVHKQMFMSCLGCSSGRDTTVRQTDMLKLSEVLQVLRMSRAGFYRMRSRGQAPRMHKLPNGHLRVRRADLDAWLDKLTENAA